MVSAEGVAAANVRLQYTVEVLQDTRLPGAVLRFFLKKKVNSGLPALEEWNQEESALCTGAYPSCRPHRSIQEGGSKPRA